MDDESPAIEDVYTFDKVLGEGSFGIVKRAVKKDTGEAFAVKMINKENLENDDMNALQQEVEILTEIDHPNVVKLYEIYEDDNYFYMVLELMTGGELFQRIVEADHFSERQAADTIRPVVDALHYCHALNVAHRDLKPENLLYASKDPGAVIKISDFGLARFVSDSNMTTMCGTPGYVAPEIIHGQGYDKAIDYWSVGVILYIMLCGFPPFYSENNDELFEMIVKGKFEFPSPAWDTISNEAKDLIKGLLTVDPKKRLIYEKISSHSWLNGKSSENCIPDIQKKIKQFSAKNQFKNSPYLETLYKEYVKRYPFNSQIWNRYAQYVKVTQSAEESEKIYQQAVQLNPRCYDLWHCYISSVKSDKNESVDDQKTIKLIEQALQNIGYDYNSAIYWEDLIGYHSENKEEAIKLYRRALGIVTKNFEDLYEKFNAFFTFCSFDQIKACYGIILGVAPSEEQSQDSMILQIKTTISNYSDITKSLFPEVVSFEQKLTKTELDGDLNSAEYSVWIQYLNFAKAKLAPEQVIFLYEKALISQCDKENLWVDYFNYLESQNQHSTALQVCRKLEYFLKAINNGLLLQWAELEELHNETEQAREVYKYISTLEENYLKNITRWIQFEKRNNSSVEKISELYEKILSNPSQKADVQQWAINDLSKLLASNNRKQQGLARYIQFFESQALNKVSYAQLLQFVTQYFAGESNLIETLSEVYLNAINASKKNPSETKNIVNMSISHLRGISQNIAEIRLTEQKIRSVESQQSQVNGESLLKKRSLIQLLGEENIVSLNGHEDIHKQVKTN